MSHGQGPFLEWRSNGALTKPPKDQEEWRAAIATVSSTVRVWLSDRGEGFWFVLLADEPPAAKASPGAKSRERSVEVVAALRAAGKSITND